MLRQWLDYVQNTSATMDMLSNVQMLCINQIRTNVEVLSNAWISFDNGALNITKLSTQHWNIMGLLNTLVYFIASMLVQHVACLRPWTSVLLNETRLLVRQRLLELMNAINKIKKTQALFTLRQSLRWAELYMSSRKDEKDSPCKNMYALVRVFKNVWWLVVWASARKPTRSSSVRVVLAKMSRKRESF